MKTVRFTFRNWFGHSGSFPEQHIYDCFPYLRGAFNFQLNDNNPDLVLYSVYNYHAKVNDSAIRLLYSGECGDWLAHGGKVDPKDIGVLDPKFFDYGITCSNSARPADNLFMPQGFLHLNLYNDGVETLVKDAPQNTREYFCNFIYSNGHSQDRIRFMEELSKYKRVECAGVVARNNHELEADGGRGYDKRGYLAKQKFQNRCKFSISMENNYATGYSTEKLTDAFVARSVPIYCGDPDIELTFNPEAFININRFKGDWKAAAEFVAMVDQDDALYMRYLTAPPFVGNVIPERFTNEFALAFWTKMLQTIA